MDEHKNEGNVSCGCRCNCKKSNKKNLAIFLAAIIIIFGALIYSPKENQDSSVNKSAEVQTESNLQETTNEDNRAQAVIAVSTGENKYEYQVKIPGEITAFDLTREVSRQKGFSLGFQESAMGAFITEIHGVKNDPQNNKYWMLKINGKLSEVGASSYVVAKDDRVEWEFQEVK